MDCKRLHAGVRCANVNRWNTGDLFGRKKILLSGVALFTIGSAVAMLSNSIGLLIGGRVIMGIGAAASEPGTLSMIRHLYPERGKRSRAIGFGRPFRVLP